MLLIGYKGEYRKNSKKIHKLQQEEREDYNVNQRLRKRQEERERIIEIDYKSSNLQ